MKKNVLNILLAHILSLITNAQIKIIDSTSLQPIPSVELLNKNGKILSLSNAGGSINKTVFLSLNTKDSVLLSHISYNKKKLCINDILQHHDTIFLTPVMENLPDVLVQSAFQKEKQLVLKGYFRSYQLINKSLVAYMDGIILYILPIKNKNRIKHILLESRKYSISDSLYPAIKDKGIATGYETNETSPPFLERYASINKIEQKYRIENIGDTLFLKNSTDNFGFVKIDSLNKKIQVNINLATPKNPIQHSLLGFKIKITQLNYLENYSCHTLKNWDNITNLSYAAMQTNSFTKYKNRIAKETENYVYRAFYVVERFYLDNYEIKNIMANKKSNFNIDDYMQNNNIPTIPTFISIFFDNKIKLKDKK